MDEIEIKSTGEIVSNYLTVGRVEFSIPFTREFEGGWIRGDSGDYDDLIEECNQLEEAAKKAEGACEKAASDIREILDDDERECPTWLRDRLDEIWEGLP